MSGRDSESTGLASNQDVALIDVLQENKRLRAALSAIAVGTPDLLPPFRIMGEAQLRAIARKTLDEIPDRAAPETTCDVCNGTQFVPVTVKPCEACYERRVSNAQKPEAPQAPPGYRLPGETEQPK